MSLDPSGYTILSVAIPAMNASDFDGLGDPTNGISEQYEVIAKVGGDLNQPAENLWAEAELLTPGYASSHLPSTRPKGWAYPWPSTSALA